MKSIPAVLLLLLFISCKGQEDRVQEKQKPVPIIKSKIDALKTNEDVEAFLIAIDTNFKSFKVQKIAEFKSRYTQKDFCKKTADSLGIDKRFYTADFDNNGYNDLLVIGNYYDFSVLVVFGDKSSNYKVKYLTRRAFQECSFPRITTVDNLPAIDYFYRSTDWDKDGKSSNQLLKKTLVYKYDDFIEYNGKIENHVIQKIEYETSGCFGTCPVFKLKIEGDKSAVFDADMYNRATRNSKEIKGHFTTTLSDTDYNQLMKLLNYIDFPNLENSYSVSWTDDQRSALRITYDDGKVKTITDYGMIGTFGLDRVYQHLAELRFNQKWK